MLFHETELAGAYLIEQERFEDERGFFARAYCRHEFGRHGLKSEFMQGSISYNKRRNTLRGMHYQVEAAAEVKLVHCVQGAIFDVIIDLRPQSPTYCRWFSAELSANNGAMLYIPEGFAHGFQTLTDNTLIYYHITALYAPQYARGVRWNDPVFAISWPLPDPFMSDKDRNLPDYLK